MPIYTGLGNGCYLPPDLHVIEMESGRQSALFKAVKQAHSCLHGSGAVHVIRTWRYGAVFLFCMGKTIVFLRAIRVIFTTL